MLYQYVLDIAKKWLSPPYNIDGWRLDVAADLGHSPEMNHQFLSLIHISSADRAERPSGDSGPLPGGSLFRSGGGHEAGSRGLCYYGPGRCGGCLLYTSLPSAPAPDLRWDAQRNRRSLGHKNRRSPSPHCKTPQNSGWGSLPAGAHKGIGPG